MLFTTTGLGQYISGAILYEETLYQDHADGEPMVDKLKKLGIIPGIKVDQGLKPLAGGLPHETYCSGIDGLVERAAKYYEQGARFAKWRSVLQITEDGPSEAAILESSWGLARYARSVQESGLVPIIEPEVLMDGDHHYDRTAEVQERIIQETYFACEKLGVYLEGTLLKPSMTCCGAECPEKVTPKDVARKTIEVVKRDVRKKAKVVGHGTVPNVHTSDLWVWPGVGKHKGKDFAVTGTWSANGEAYFWDVTDPSNMILIDTIKVDARTVNDVKVSQDGKICVISREGASNLSLIHISEPTRPY